MVYSVLCGIIEGMKGIWCICGLHCAEW